MENLLLASFKLNHTITMVRAVAEVESPHTCRELRKTIHDENAKYFSDHLFPVESETEEQEG